MEGVDCVAETALLGPRLALSLASAMVRGSSSVEEEEAAESEPSSSPGCILCISREAADAVAMAAAGVWCRWGLAKQFGGLARDWCTTAGTRTGSCESGQPTLRGS